MAGKEAESGESTLVKTVRRHTFENIEVFYGMEQPGALPIAGRDSEGFHGVEQPEVTNKLARRHREMMYHGNPYLPSLHHIGQGLLKAAKSTRSSSVLVPSSSSLHIESRE